jgi:hypothetical protein
MATSGDKISEALFNALTTCERGDLAELEGTLKAFKETFHRSYDGVRKQPFARKLIDAMEEAIEMRKDMES